MVMRLIKRTLRRLLFPFATPGYYRDPALVGGWSCWYAVRGYVCAFRDTDGKLLFDF